MRRHGLFRTVKLRGTVASVTWGYHTAAVLRTYTVYKSEDGDWTVTAGVDRADPFLLARKSPPLLFTAPRKGGRFCFPIRSVTLSRESLSAQLGPPEY